MQFELLSESAAGNNQLDVPFARSGHRILATNRYVYVIGGFNAALWNEGNDASVSYPILREVWRYDVYMHEWRSLKIDGEIPYEMASHTAVFDQNYALIFGGSGVPFGQQNSGRLHALNLRTFKWQTLFVPPSTPGNTIMPSEGYGQATVMHDRKLHVVGGTCGHAYNCDVHILNMEQFPCKEVSWDTVTKPRHADLERYRHECVIFNEQLLLFGGGTSNDARTLNTLDVIDLKTGRWYIQSTYPDIKHGYPAPRRCLGLGRFKDVVYICGGINNGADIHRDVWMFALTSHKWTKMSMLMPIPLYFHGFAISENGCMYLYGGITTDGVRNSTLYRCWLTTPSLKQICSEFLAKKMQPHLIEKQKWIKLIAKHCFSGQRPFSEF